MYLVPKKVYDKFLTLSSTTTKDMVHQINNLDVQSGAKVTINSDCKNSADSYEKTSLPSEDEEKTSPEETDEIEPFQPPEPDYEDETEPPADNYIPPNNASQPPEPKDSQPSGSNETKTLEESGKKSIFVLDDFGIKIPRVVDQSKLDRLDWTENGSDQKNDLFMDSNNLKMKTGSRKRFNKKYVSAPYVLKRNLTPSAAKQFLEDQKDVIKEGASEKEEPSLTLNIIDDEEKSPKSAQSPRVKVNEIGDKTVPLITDLKSKGAKRKRDSSSSVQQPQRQRKEPKRQRNLRKRSYSNKLESIKKKTKIDWDGE